MLLEGQRALPARLTSVRLRILRADDRRRARARPGRTAGSPRPGSSATMVARPTSRHSAGTTSGTPRSSRFESKVSSSGRVAVQHRGAYDVLDRGGRAARKHHQSPAQRSRTDRPSKVDPCGFSAQATGDASSLLARLRQDVVGAAMLDCDATRVETLLSKRLERGAPGVVPAECREVGHATIVADTGSRRPSRPGRARARRRSSARRIRSRRR